MVSDRESIRYHVVPGAWRGLVLSSPEVLDAETGVMGDDSWRPVEVQPAVR